MDDCTRFHDIVVKCIKGFYLNYHKDCKPCTKCTSTGRHEGQACSETEDAVCCDTEGMMVKQGECVAPENYCAGPEKSVLLGQECISCEKCKPCGIGSNISFTQQYNFSSDHTERDDGTEGGSLWNTFGVGLVVGILIGIVIGIALVFGLVIYCRMEKISTFFKCLCDHFPKIRSYNPVRQNSNSRR